MDLDEFVRNPLSQVKRKRRTSLPEEYDQSLLSSITHTGVSGLSGLGNFLDIPGSVVRDTLAGENPFDQLAPWNWFSSEGRTTGRELLRKNRLIGRKNHWSNWLGGMGTEIALDPLTYLTFGASALSKAGKIGKAAGLLDDVTKLRNVGPRVGRMTSTLDELVQGAVKPAEGWAHGPMTLEQATRRSALERAAAAAGENLDELYNMPLGGLASPVGPLSPLGGTTGVWGRAGGVGEKIAGGMDWAGRKLAESPPGVFMSGLFDPAARNQFTKSGQALARAVTQEQQAAGPLGRMAGFELGDTVNPALQEVEQLAGSEIMEAAKRRMVGPAEEAWQALSPSAPRQLQKEAQSRIKQAKDAFDSIDKAAEVHRVANGLAAHIGEKGVKDALSVFDIRMPEESFKGLESAISKVQEFNANLIASVNDMGGDVHLLDDESLGHLARYANVSKMSFADKSALESAISQEAMMRGVTVEQLPEDVVKRVTAEAGSGKAFKLAGTKTAVDMARTHETRTVPRAIVNQLLTDPQLRQRPGTAEGQVVAAQHILDTYGQHLDPKYVGRTKPQAAASLAKWVEKNQGRPGFTEMLERQTKNLDTPDAKNSIEQHAWELAQHVRTHARRERYTNDVMQDQIRYSEAGHRKKGMLTAVHHFLRQNAGEINGVPLDQVFKDAGMDPEKAVEFFAKQGGLTAEQARHMNVPQDVAAAVTSVVRSQPGSVWGQEIGRIIDWFNDFTRKTLTIPFPSFHVRNLSSGQYINMATGAIQNPEDFRLYQEAIGEAHKLRANQDDIRWREIEAHRVSGRTSGQRGAVAAPPPGFEDVTPSTTTIPGFMQNNPLLRAAGRGYAGAMNLGSGAMQWVEYYNRVPLYLYYRKKGYEPLQAALEVKKRHFDYQELTDAERNLFRRGMLFYSFTRKLAPLMVETLTQRPGGVMAQTIKATGRLHDEQDQPVPQYIQETTAIPLGTSEDGTLRYITGLGLPQEDIASFAPSPVQELLSRTSPLIKAPIEMATGQSLFQRGRPLDELDPSIGRIRSNITEWVTGEKVKTRATPFLGQGFEFAAANSPASRLLSTARTLTDPRKGAFGQAVNLLTGGRITDVSPAAQDAELGRRAAEVMKRLGARSFTKTYVPKEDQANLSSQDLQLLSGLEMLQRQRAARARARAAQ